MPLPSPADAIAPVELRHANAYDVDRVMNYVGYEPVDDGPVYQHRRTGATCHVLYDEATGYFTGLTATTPVVPSDPDSVATVAFTGATRLGVIMAALLAPQWVEACEQAATTADERRRQRITELRAELARLEDDQATVDRCRQPS